MNKLLVVLQCAYGTSKRRRRQLEIRKLWLKALWSSHTGRRLKKMLPDNVIVEVINSTPRIGDISSACFPAESVYIAGWIECFEPDIILACGKVAQNALEELGIKYIPSPHPAWRQLSNEQIDKIRSTIIGNLHG
jgi:hypothetical protein